jgi:hypothetical protein
MELELELELELETVFPGSSECQLWYFSEGQKLKNDRFLK